MIPKFMQPENTSSYAGNKLILVTESIEVVSIQDVGYTKCHSTKNFGWTNLFDLDHRMTLV
jgi:hypothetical protein